MLYNYGAAILRAVGDTKRPLFFLVAAGVINAGLNLLLVIVFDMGVAGVAIGTIVSQMISSILVLRCLCRSEGSYKLSFSKLRIRGIYMKQIFQVGIPAGIQSTVINFSNVLLQSSVNSFGSTAMAGYTAANNIFGFLYVTVNSVTQTCMSFTSQNYGAGKSKRMDKVLIDCIILSVVITSILGVSAYGFGPELLKIYTEDAKVIQCGMEILLYTTVTYFLCGLMDLFPGALRGMGHSAGSDDPFGNRNSRDKNCLDFLDLSCTSFIGYFIYFLSCILDHYDHYAGDLLLFREKKSTPGYAAAGIE